MGKTSHETNQIITREYMSYYQHERLEKPPSRSMIPTILLVCIAGFIMANIYCVAHLCLS